MTIDSKITKSVSREAVSEEFSPQIDLDSVFDGNKAQFYHHWREKILIHELARDHFN